MRSGPLGRGAVATGVPVGCTPAADELRWVTTDHWVDACRAGSTDGLLENGTGEPQVKMRAQKCQRVAPMSGRAAAVGDRFTLGLYLSRRRASRSKTETSVR